MSSLRVALVVRKFWPIVDGTQRLVSNLAHGLQRLGHAPTILTAQWEKHWPREFIYRDVQVIRFPNWMQTGWGTLRYMSTLSRWLRGNSKQFDAVYVTGLKYDAYTVVGMLRKGPIPVTLSAVETGPDGDCAWHEQARFGWRIRRRCQLADAMVTLSDAASVELQNAGFARDKIVRIDKGVRTMLAQDAARRTAARKSLGKTHDILSLKDDTPLAIYIGPFNKSMGLMPLMEAWHKVVGRLPNAKLWMMGDGPFGLPLWERVGELDLMHNIIFPGTFDDVTDVLQAADLFVQPGPHNHLATAVLEAMACGTPVLSARSPESLDLLGSRTPMLDQVNSETLAEALLRVLQNEDRYVQTAELLRPIVAERFSLEQMVRQHVELFRRLVVEKQLR